MGATRVRVTVLQICYWILHTFGVTRDITRHAFALRDSKLLWHIQT